MLDPVKAWHEEHMYFNRLLRMLRKELDVFHSGDTPNYQLMLDIIAYLREYADQYHHPREDEAFRRLHQKLDARLAAGELTVVDATSVERWARDRLLQAARRHGRPAVALVLAVPLEVTLFPSRPPATAETQARA